MPCPQCRQEFSTRQFQTNYLVAGLVDKVRASSSDGYAKNIEVGLNVVPSSGLVNTFPRHPFDFSGLSSRIMLIC